MTTMTPPAAQPGARAQTSPFYVLLGPDYAGKSTAMAELARRRPDWPLLSVDDDLVGDELLAALRRGLMRHALPGLGDAYSREFVVSLLQTAVVHLGDRVLANNTGRPAVVDSYHYKLLAKCRLLTDRADTMVGWWRALLPRPDLVFFLDVDPELAWARSGHGALLNPLEHHGLRGDRASFLSYQADLRAAMLEEVAEVPVHFLDPAADPAGVARELCQVVAP